MRTEQGLSKSQALLATHFCVLVWGFTAILGKAITLASAPLVAWRMSLTAVCLFFMARAWRHLRTFSAADFAHMSFAGGLIALHWLTFYASVKLANASVGVLCMAIGPIFSALLTPWLSDDRFSWRNFGLALSVLPGMLLVVGGVDTGFYAGIAVGVLSAALVACFGLVNKKLVERFDVLTLSFVEIATGAVLIWVVFWLSDARIWVPMPSAQDWPMLLVFVVVCTAIPFALAGVALKQLSAFSAQFAVNLEPVYGILFAAWLLGEAQQLNLQFYVGATVILLGVFAQAFMSLRSTDQA
jgi:drug/metabolite transporter (DMT)-like permease